MIAEEVCFNTATYSPPYVLLPSFSILRYKPHPPTIYFYTAFTSHFSTLLPSILASPFLPLLTSQDLLRLTLLNTSVVWLDELFGDLSTINKECVTLRALVTEDSGTIECKVQLLGEFALWVCDEAEL